MTESYIIAHDLGTSGNKAALTNLAGTVKAAAFRPYEVRYSPDGGAEQDPEAWWQAIVETTQDVLAKAGVDPKQIAGLSMSAQMVGTLPVDAAGEPLRWAMIWLDSRAQKEAEWLREQTGFDFIDGKAPSAKALWIMRNEPDIFARTGKILDCKDFLLFRMTGAYATDFSLSSATTLFNPWTREWWPEVCSAMELPIEKLPSVVPSTEVMGRLTATAADQMGLIEGTPVVCGGGDVPCAVVGSGALSPGRGHLYLGTSAWVVVITPEFIMDPDIAVGPGVGCDLSTYNLCGEMDNAGGCLKWFNETLLGKEEQEKAAEEGISVFQLMDRMAETVPPGSEGLIFLPWLWGERAPVNDEGVRGGFACLGSNHTKAHLIRSILEGVGHHLRWIFGEFEKAGMPQKEVHVIGGGAASPTWLQILADTTNVKLLQVERPLDACARGAAMTAAVGLGVYKDFDEVEKVIRLTGAEFSPNPEYRELYDKAYANFRSLYSPLSDIGNNRVPPVKEVKHAGFL